MSSRRSIASHKFSSYEVLESRIFLANSHVFLDFGDATTAVSARSISANYSGAANAITTPAHQDGAVVPGSQTFNNVSQIVPGTIYSFDGSPSTISLQWATSTGKAVAIPGTSWAGGTPTYLGKSTATSDVKHQEFNNDIANDVVTGTLTNEGDVALKISGLEQGTYKIYFMGNRPVNTGEVFSTQDVQIATYTAGEISAGKVKYDPDRAQLSGAYYANGKFSNPSDYFVQTVTVNTGDSVVIIVHGLAHTVGSNSALVNFNLAQIVKTGVASTTPAWAPEALTQSFTNETGGQQPVNFVGWNAYHGSPAVDHTAAVVGGAGDKVGIESVGGNPGGAGYLFSHNTNTASYLSSQITEFDSPITPSRITWRMGNSDTNIAVRLLVKSGGNWYATDTPFTSAEYATAGAFASAAQSAVEKSFAFTTAASIWRSVTINPGSPMTLGAVLTTNLASGSITGVGFHITHSAAVGRVARIDAISVVPRDGTFANSSGAQQAVSYVGWNAYKGNNGFADLTNIVPVGGDKIGIGTAAGSPAGAGFLWAGNSTTTNQTFAATQSLGTPVAPTKISWRMGNAATNTTVRVLVKIGEEWFASNQTFSNSTAYASDAAFSSAAQSAIEQTFNFTTDASAWRKLNLVTGGTPSMSLGGAQTSNLASNSIDGIGFFIETLTYNTVARLDNLSLTPGLPQFISAGASESYADWVEQESVYNLGFLDQASWANIANADYYLTTWQTWKAANPNGKMVIGVPMFWYENDDNVPNHKTIMDNTLSWTNATSTDPAENYDGYFATLATNLLNAGLGDSHLRIGWEFNGDWYPWKAKGNEANYASYFRRIVNVMRSTQVAGKVNDFKFVWNPNFGGHPTAMSDAEASYPGNAYVDFIGPDIYDTVGSIYSGTLDDRQRERAITHELFDNTSQGNILGRGMSFYRDFAAKQGKPLVIPEWGVTDANNSGNDNTLFVRMMHSFITDPDNNVAYHGYFDTSIHKLAPGASGKFVTKYPQAKGMFRRLMGGDEQAIGFGDNIGAPANQGTSSYNASARHWTITGSGDALADGSDQFHFANNKVSGDQTMIARITSLSDVPDTALAKAGVMMRAGTAVGSLYAVVVMTEGGAVQFQYRGASNTTPTIVTGSASGVSAAWVKLVRTGDRFTAFYALTPASGGEPVATDWILIRSATLAISSTDYRAGMAVASGNTGKLATATFNAFSVNANATPAGWTGADIGATIGTAPFAGSAQFDPAAFTLTAGGATIGGTSDQFHYAYQTINPLTAPTTDQTIVARVDSVTNATGTNVNARNGIMFRQSTAAGSPFVMAFVKPSGELVFYYRSTLNGTAAVVTGGQLLLTTPPTPTSPMWLMLVKTGNTFTAYYNNTSDNGTGPDETTLPVNGWAAFPNAQSVTFSGTFLAGLAQSANDVNKLGVSTYGWATVSPNPIGHQIGLKVRHNNMINPWYATVKTGSSNEVWSDQTSITSDLQRFQVLDAGGGLIAIKNVSNGRYLTVDSTSKRLKATVVPGSPDNPAALGNYAKFSWVDTGDGKVGLWNIGTQAWVRWYDTSNALRGDSTSLSANGANSSIFTYDLLT